MFDPDELLNAPVAVKAVVSLIAVCSCAVTLFLLWQKPPRTADFWKLKVTTDKLISDWQPIISAGNGVRPYLTREQKMEWLIKTRELLDSQNENPLLLRDVDALANWRSAQDAVRLAMDFERALLEGRVNVQPPDPNANFEHVFANFREQIVKGVLAVHVRKIFGSDEPGGGRGPKPKPLD